MASVSRYRTCHDVSTEIWAKAGCSWRRYIIDRLLSFSSSKITDLRPRSHGKDGMIRRSMSSQSYSTRVNTTETLNYTFENYLGSSRGSSFSYLSRAREVRSVIYFQYAKGTETLVRFGKDPRINIMSLHQLRQLHGNGYPPFILQYTKLPTPYVGIRSLAVEVSATRSSLELRGSVTQGCREFAVWHAASEPYLDR